MTLLCIWGETKADVAAGYDAVAASDASPESITWRLTAAFDGSPVGDACYAPDHPEIRAAYTVDEKIAAAEAIEDDEEVEEEIEGEFDDYDDD